MRGRMLALSIAASYMVAHQLFMEHVDGMCSREGCWHYLMQHDISVTYELLMVHVDGKEDIAFIPECWVEGPEDLELHTWSQIVGQ